MPIFEPEVALPKLLPNNAHWFACTGNMVVLRREGATGVAQCPSVEELRRAGLDVSAPHMVGMLDGVPCVAVSWGDHPVPEHLEKVGLRGLSSRFDEAVFAIAGRANQIAHFASTHQFCGQCGTRTERDPAERAFRCPSCRLVAYPRISPAIITLVRRGAEALLASSARFPGAFFSTLAGFSEIGESLEQTLIREIKEEVGVVAGNPRYFGSQPWPFPHSLMIGFNADYVSGEIAVDGKEISEARFFRADQLPQIPPKLSIARQLIDAWVSEVTKKDPQAV